VRAGICMKREYELVGGGGDSWVIGAMLHMATQLHLSRIGDAVRPARQPSILTYVLGHHR
jgi:hypothetical protein